MPLFFNVALYPCYLKPRDRQILKQPFLMGNNTYYLMRPFKSMYMESEIWNKAFCQKYISTTSNGKSQSHILVKTI